MSEQDVVQEQVTYEIVRDAMASYGAYVLEDRVLADVRDGQKPVQRRLLWTLWEERRHSKAVPAKCAEIIGATTGRYHPHGDSAAYQALVHLSWLRYPLVEQHGNFGSPYSLVPAKPAAHRYTETRLTPLADHLFDDISVVERIPNYTETRFEPAFLPARVPLLLLNGSQGLAPGLSSNLPPHHMGEVINAAQHALRNPECTTDDLLKYIKGPDYGRGVLLSNKADLRRLYETGQGKLRFSCQYKFENGHKRGVRKLIITGLAPNFNPSKFEEETVQLQQQKLLVKSAYDDGTKDSPTRIVIEFKDPLVIRDRILPKLETSVSYRLYALDDQKGILMWSLKNLLLGWIDSRRKVERAVLEARAEDLQKRIGIETARLAAIVNLKILLQVLAKTKTLKGLHKAVVKYLKVEPWQADIILKLQVAALRRASKSDVESKIEVLQEELDDVRKDLEDIDSVIARRLAEMEAFVDKRGTRLRQSGQEDLDSDVLYWIAVTPDGKVERFDKPPTRSRAAWSYVGLEPAKETIALVTDRNVGQSVSLSSIDKLAKDSGTVVGFATGRHAAVVVITRKGRYVAFEPEQKRTSFPAMRLQEGDAILAAVGIREVDKVLVRRDSSALFRLSYGKADGCQAISVTRPGTKPKGIRGKGEVTHVWVECPDEDLRTSTRTLTNAKRIQDPTDVRRYAAKNLVIDSDQKRKVVGLKTARKLVSEHPNTVVIPLPEVEE